jgi:hypothetical protein
MFCLWIQGLYIFTFSPDLSAKALFVQPSKNPTAESQPISCMQLTDHRIYFMWEDVRHRGDIPLFEDAENVQERLLPIAPADLELLQWLQIGRYSFAK